MLYHGKQLVEFFLQLDYIFPGNQIQTGKILNLFYKRVKDIRVPNKISLSALLDVITQFLMRVDYPFVHVHI